MQEIEDGGEVETGGAGTGVADGWLSEAEPGGVEALMRDRGWLGEGERVLGVSRAGEGNMNVAMRVRLGGAGVGDRSVVLKQARPWVAKYPTIAAPLERAEVERSFYALLPTLGEAGERVASMMPRLLGGDSSSSTVLLEDLGEAADLTSVYGGGAVSDEVVTELAGYLRGLHDASAGRAGERLVNRSMRELNHAHLCEVPMDEANGLDLDAIEPGLAAAAAELRADARYRLGLAETGAAYLGDVSADGEAVLLHGDFFPGSWLATVAGVRVIDPEFGFDGPRAFDLGVAVAHFVLADRSEAAGNFLSGYGVGEVPMDWVGRFAAMEVMRRLVGVAQLPLGDRPAGWRAERLRSSREAMVSGDWLALRL